MRALITCSPYILPRYMFLYLPQDVIGSVARFRLVPKPYKLKQCPGPYFVK